jgi:hypothetical protein
LDLIETEFAGMAARVPYLGRVCLHHQSGMTQDYQAPTTRVTAAWFGRGSLDRRT